MRWWRLYFWMAGLYSWICVLAGHYAAYHGPLDWFCPYGIENAAVQMFFIYQSVEYWNRRKQKSNLDSI